ncbi:MAG: calcium-binding protein [Caulobacteraceae bacterium]
MAVTTTYSFEAPKALNLLDGASSGNIYDVDLVSLANGGFAASGDHYGSHVDTDVFNGKLKGGVADSFYSFLNSSITQLTGGNIVTVGESSGNLLYSIQGSGGVVDQSLGLTNTSKADVSGLSNGGFVVTGQEHFAGNDNDIKILVRNADGSQAVAPFVISGSTDNDENASVAGLVGGGFAVAWDRDDGAGNTEIWSAVYESNGTIRKAAAIVDTAGSHNTDAQTVALDSGGFAVVYQDNGVDGTDRITYFGFGADGTQGPGLNLATNLGIGARAAEPSITQLSNGLLVVTYTVYSDSDLDKQIYAEVIDPDTNTLLTSAPQRLSPDGEYGETNSSAAAFGLAGLAVGWDGQGASTHLVRTSTGDGAKNKIIGDDAIDNMYGLAGLDTLKGGNGNDSLDGGADADALEGGKGNDLLIGGARADSLTGGIGKDTFKFLALSESGDVFWDTITDLTNKDKIDVKAIDADIFPSGNQAFHIVGSFTGNVGELVVQAHFSGIYAGQTTVQLDMDGDGFSDFLLAIDGNHASFTNFVL